MIFNIGDVIGRRYPIQINECLEEKKYSELYRAKLIGTELLMVMKASNYILKNEFEILTSIRHPGIPRVMDYVSEEKYSYVVMPYYYGENLERIVSRCGAMSEIKVLDIAKQLCEILVFLQERDRPILHNDIKPSNILLKEDGNVILLDFGLAGFEGEKRECVLFQGTLGYAAPECWHQERLRLTKATDAFSFGATLFRLLENKQPKDCYGNFVLSDCEKHKRWQDIINKCCTLEPKYRYQNAAQILDALYCIKIK